MLEYAKVILPKVSFSKELFEKELKKCIGWITPKEIEELKDWCLEKFRNEHPEILNKLFSEVAA
ncbi:hypothetical protein EYV94_19500 [Puteibacter caeruleilacunae]|nr:hypothetical protein EYV94_19500 [Puteibacter caeruleilacunae]